MAGRWRSPRSPGRRSALVLGRHVDMGHARRAVAIAYGVMAAVVMLRAASLGSAWLAVAANALGALALPLLMPVLGKRDLQSHQGLPMSAALPDRGGSGMGSWLHRRLPHAPRRSRPPARRCRSPSLLALPALAVAAHLLRRYFESRAAAPA